MHLSFQYQQPVFVQVRLCNAPEFDSFLDNDGEEQFALVPAVFTMLLILMFTKGGGRLFPQNIRYVCNL